MKTIRRIGRWLGLTAFVLLTLGVVYVLLSMNTTEEIRQTNAETTARPYVEPLTLEGTVTRDTAKYFPYPSALLTGEMHASVQELAYDERVQGQRCRVIERVYTDTESCTVTVRSATPAAYLTSYADCTVTQELYAMLDGRTAQYLEGDARVCLLMRDGETLYAIETADGNDALLRAAAALTFE